jgi:hypothetical protein
MSAPNLIGFGPSEIVGLNRMLRVTFGAASRFNPDALFGLYWPSVYEKLAPIARFIPISTPSVVGGATVAVVSGNNKVARTGAELVNALQTAADGNFVEVRTVELLAPAVAKAETGTTGIATRDKIAAQETEKDDANSITKKIADAFGVTAKVAALIAVAVVLVIVWVYIPKGKSS